jgi:hypothetical protein
MGLRADGLRPEEIRPHCGHDGLAGQMDLFAKRNWATEFRPNIFFPHGLFEMGLQFRWTYTSITWAEEFRPNFLFYLSHGLPEMGFQYRWTAYQKELGHRVSAQRLV